MRKLALALILLIMLFLNHYIQTVWSEKVEVKVGENVTLNCIAPNETVIEDTGFYWDRADFQHRDYALLHRDGRLDEHNQVPQFKGRVTLAHPDLKNNNISINVTNVNVNDSGTFQCKLLQRGTSDLVRGKPIRTIELVVTDGEKKKSSDGEEKKSPDGEKKNSSDGEKKSPDGEELEKCSLWVNVGVPVIVLLLIVTGLVTFFIIRKMNEQTRAKDMALS